MIAPLLALALAVQPSGALDQRRATVMQFEIRLPATMTAAEQTAATAIFARDTRTIRKCPDAIAIAARYRQQSRFTGSITQRADIPLGALPADLQRELARIPAGHATRVFGSTGVRRVLIACTVPAIPKAAARREI
ncbi:hypothetical protein [Sphingomonas hankookensis]|uniref:Uncharacterized protein n=1 Tax=Sphingomonas hengshuiensis TaxID=1609977 RepID=A0A2W4Z1U3_9SPHN|nr:MAG: hypothetical protein DI632_11230 [Sphingomonas hengshuiensis]